MTDLLGPVAHLISASWFRSYGCDPNKVPSMSRARRSDDTDMDVRGRVSRKMICGGDQRGTGKDAISRC